MPHRLAGSDSASRLSIWWCQRLRALATAAHTTSRRKGFTMKSQAPSFMASTAFCTVPKALTMMNCASGCIVCADASNARPPMAGMRRSATTTWTSRSRRTSTASTPLHAVRAS